MVLSELKAADKPTIMVFNKKDKLEHTEWLKDLAAEFDHVVAISALKGKDVGLLIQKIEDLLSEQYREVELKLPLDRMDLVNLLHKEGKVSALEYLPTEIKIKASVSESLAKKLGSFWKN